MDDEVCGVGKAHQGYLRSPPRACIGRTGQGIGREMYLAGGLDQSKKLSFARLKEKLIGCQSFGI